MPKKREEAVGNGAAILGSGDEVTIKCAKCGPDVVKNTTAGPWVLRSGQLSECPCCAPPKPFGVPKNGLYGRPLGPSTLA